MISKFTQTSQNTECPVDYFNFNKNIIKKDLFVKNTLSSKVQVCSFYTFIFNSFSNDFKFVKY